MDCPALTWRCTRTSSATMSSISATRSRWPRSPAGAPRLVVAPLALLPRLLRLLRLHPLPPRRRQRLAPRDRALPDEALPDRALPDKALRPAEDEAVVVVAVSQRPWQWHGKTGTA